MAKTRAEMITRLDSIVKHDTSHLTPADVIQAIERAAWEYSKYRPREMYKDYTGDGSTQTWAVPTDWEDGFSQIISVEWPLGELPPETDQTEQFPWDVYYDLTAAAWKFRLPEDTPTSSETVRIRYTIRHTISENAFTVPDADFYAVCDIAAEECCRILASYYAQSGDTTISADAVSWGTKSGEYRSLAKEFRKKWQDALGVSEEGPAAAGVIVDWDLSSGIDQGDLLFHERRSR